MNNGRLEMELHKIGGILDRVHWKYIQKLVDYSMLGTA